MALNDEKLTALNRGNPSNSNGLNIATAVNDSIDAIIALQNQGITDRTDIDALQTLTAGHTTSIGENTSDIVTLQNTTATHTTQIAQLNNDVDRFAREWSNLTGQQGYNTEAYYQGDKYLTRSLINDVTIAPPDRLNRTYFEFDGTADYVNIPTISLVANDIVRFKFRAPTETSTMYLLDHNSGSDRIQIALEANGTYLFPADLTLTVDGVQVSNTDNYPLDGLLHEVQATLSTPKNLSRIGADFNAANFYRGQILDVEVIRSSNRIHYYPLRNDAVDYRSGNIVSDEEFTWGNNYILQGDVAVVNNVIDFPTATGTNSLYDNITTTSQTTYRMIVEAVRTSGAVAFSDSLDGQNISNNIALIQATGTRDIIYVPSVDRSFTGFIEVSGDYIGTLSNWRLIELDELSPSANFTSATGFVLSNVTVTGGQAVFSSAVASSIRNQQNLAVGDMVRVSGSFSGRTAGSLNIFSWSGSNATTLATVATTGATGTFDITAPLTEVSIGVGAQSSDWIGNIDQMSITRVTDGTEVGTIPKNLDNQWTNLTGNNFLPKTAGDLRLGENYYIGATSTLAIEPLSNKVKGEKMLIAREGTFQPVITLSAGDITAGKRLVVNGTEVTTFTIDDDVVTGFYYNGDNVEVKT